MTANKGYHFLRRSDKVFNLTQKLQALHDGRTWCLVPLASVMKILLLGFACRLGSLNRIEQALENGLFDEVLGRGAKPSADAISYAVKRTEPKEVKELISQVVQKARRNKLFPKGTVDGYVVCGVDGTELYKTKADSRRCTHCSVRTRKEGDEEVWREYYERAVAISYVGDGPNLVVGLERQGKGEGELPASLRLLQDLYWRNSRYCDVIAGDALYAAAPFFNAANEQGKWVVVRAKREDLRVIVDAEGLFAQRGPDFESEGITEFKGASYDLRIWDEEDFDSWDGVNGTLRVLRVEETRRCIKNGRSEETKQITHIVTTCPQSQVKPLTVWRIMHARWGIENRVFHQAKTHCSLEHSYIHHEIATEVLWQLQVLALNLMLLFRWNRHNGKRPGMTELADIIMATLLIPVRRLDLSPG